MKITRREAIEYSCLTVAGFSLAGLKPEEGLALAQGPSPTQAQEPWPDTLVERPIRNIAPLPLNPDGSAPGHGPGEAGTISEPSLWRYNNNQPPQIDYDYRNLRIKVDSRGHARKMGTLRFADLDPLPRHSDTYLLQCGAPNPRGIVKWTGVRFSDFAEMLGIQPFAHYARIIGGPLLGGRGLADAAAATGDALVAHERPADSSEARRAAAAHHPVPLRSAPRQSDLGNHLHTDGIPAAHAAGIRRRSRGSKSPNNNIRE